MNVLWEIDLAPIDSEWDLYGKFFSHAASNYFLYKRNNNLELLCFSDEGIVLRQNTFSNCAPDIPAFWQVSNADNHVIVCGNNLAFYIDTLTLSTNPPVTILEGYRANPHHLTDDSFCFGDRIISHRGAFGYRCTKVGSRNKIWDITLNGYLYRDVVFFAKTNSVLFCTAGHRGSVYSVDIESGRMLFEVKTGGTKDIVIVEEALYCYRLGKAGRLLEVNLNTGVVTKEYYLHEIDIHSPLQIVHDSILLAVSRKRIKGHRQIPIIYGFDL